MVKAGCLALGNPLLLVLLGVGFLAEAPDLGAPRRCRIDLSTLRLLWLEKFQ